jgi:hypothetical protein
LCRDDRESGVDDPTAAGWDLEKFFTVLDVANGVGSRLSIGDWTFKNPDTTVQLHREPVGNCGYLRRDGGRPKVTARRADLHHTAGPVGRSAQTGLIRPVKGVA